MTRKISILFITQGVNEAASRFRVQQYLIYFKKEEYRFLCFPLHWGKKHPDNYGLGKYFWYIAIIFFKFISIFFALFFDVVFIQRCVLRHISPWLEKIIRIFNKKIIFDFDDTIWLNYLDKQKNPVAEIIKISKEIIAGNKFLFDYAIQYNRNITIIPTPVDTDLLKPIAVKKNLDYITIGWTGTFSNHQYLYQLKSVFKKIKLKYSDRIKLKILSDCQPEKDLGINYDYIEWSPKNEICVIPDFDIGIMPLTNNQWAEGKCAFKVLQYMAAGVTVIASPVGMNKEVLKSGIGLLAENNQEWYEAFCKLIENSNLRNQLARSARIEVIEKYSLKSNFRKFKRVIDQCAL